MVDNWKDRRMKFVWLFGLSLLLWMVIKKASGEETSSGFIRDIIATFKLNSPTIIYDSDEAPEICFTDGWVLCLSAKDQEMRTEEQTELQKLSTIGDGCVTASGPSGPGKKCIFPFSYNGVTYNSCTPNSKWCATKVDDDGELASFYHYGFCGYGCFG